MSTHMGYKSLYIAWPSSAKQQLKMTNCCLLWSMRTTAANVSYFHSELNAFITLLAWERLLGVVLVVASRELRKPRRHRQRQRHQTKGSTSKKMSMHVHYQSLYISCSSSAKQERETTILVFWRT